MQWLPAAGARGDCLRWNTDLLLREYGGAGRGDNAGPNAAEETEGRSEIETSAQFIRSPARWSYMHMILQLETVVNKLEAFFKSCPCHPSLIYKMRGESWARRHRAFIETLDMPLPGMHLGSCPMQGAHGRSRRKYDLKRPAT